jgi:hypothetical protein
MAGYKGSPLTRSHTMVVSRWLAIPEYKQHFTDITFNLSAPEQNLR